MVRDPAAAVGSLDGDAARGQRPRVQQHFAVGRAPAQRVHGIVLEQQKRVVDLTVRAPVG